MPCNATHLFSRSAVSALNQIVIEDARGVRGAYPAVCMMCGEAPATRMDPRLFTSVNPWSLLLLLFGPLGLGLLLGSEHKRTAMVYTCTECRPRSWGLRPMETLSTVTLFLVSLWTIGALVLDSDATTVYGLTAMVLGLLVHLLRGTREGRIWAVRITRDALVLHLPNTRYATLFEAYTPPAEAAASPAEATAPPVDAAALPAAAPSPQPARRRGVRVAARCSHRVTRRSH